MLIMLKQYLAFIDCLSHLRDPKAFCKLVATSWALLQYFYVIPTEKAALSLNQYIEDSLVDS